MMNISQTCTENPLSKKEGVERKDKAILPLYLIHSNNQRFLPRVKDPRRKRNIPTPPIRRRTVLMSLSFDLSRSEYPRRLSEIRLDIFPRFYSSHRVSRLPFLASVLGCRTPWTLSFSLFISFVDSST